MTYRGRCEKHYWPGDGIASKVPNKADRNKRREDRRASGVTLKRKNRAPWLKYEGASK